MAKRPQAAIFRGLAGRKLATDDVLHAGGSEVGTEGDGAPVAAGDYTPPPAPVPTSEPPAPEPPAPEPPAPEPGQVEGDRPSRRRRDPPAPEPPAPEPPAPEPLAPEPPAPEPGQVEGDRPSRRRRDPPGPELPFLYTSATIARRGGHAS